MRALLIVLCCAVAASAAHAPARDATEGRVLYGRYCASCHGVAADGHGPVASVLTRPPADLRHLGDRFGRPLRAAELGHWIDGREDVVAHGTRAMPVWGERFRALEGSVDPRIRAIVVYLETLQR
jgi:mono/diheme cytochrome c family protein